MTLSEREAREIGRKVKAQMMTKTHTPNHEGRALLYGIGIAVILFLSIATTTALVATIVLKGWVIP